MDLADSIYEASGSEPKDSADMGYDDELGLRVWDNIDYVVARAIAIGIRDRKDPYTIHQPHVREDKVFIGNERIEENLHNLYRLTEIDRRISQTQQIIFWRKLKTFLPKLEPRVIQVSDNLFWDKEDGNVKNKEEIYEKYLFKKDSQEEPLESSGDMGNY